MADGLVSCPICEASVSIQAIEKHVDDCLKKSEGPTSTNITSSISPKINGKRTVSISSSAKTRKRPSVISPGSSPKQSKIQSSSKCITSAAENNAGSSTFSSSSSAAVPLYETVRPTTLDEFVGQEDIAGEGSLMKQIVETGSVPSLILWGPPGCGKVQKKCGAITDAQERWLVIIILMSFAFLFILNQSITTINLFFSFPFPRLLLLV